MTNAVSIIIPIKDEPNLPNLVSDLEALLLGTTHQIIIVTSDKSKISISEIEYSISQRFQTKFDYKLNVTVLKSYGDSLERAILLGFSVAQYDKIIVMDADGSHPPELVSQIIQKLDDYEMVVASRFCKGGKYRTSLFRYIVTFFFNEYAKLLGSTLSDPMSGFFGIQSQLLQKIKFKPFKWKVALEINNKLRPKILEIPFIFHKREEGKSNSSWKIGLRILWDISEGAL